jgi:hypothetical protein
MNAAMADLDDAVKQSWHQFLELLEPLRPESPALTRGGVIEKIYRPTLGA